MDNCPTTTTRTLATTAPNPPFTSPQQRKSQYKPLSIAIKKPDKDITDANAADNFFEDISDNSQLQPLITD